MFGGMGSLISLTADQKQQIKAILEKYRPSRDHGEKASDSARKQWKETRIALRDSIKNAILSVLTADQKAFLDQIKSQLKSGTVPDTIVKIRIQRLTTLLTLTDSQQTQAFSILKQDMQEKLLARSKDSAAVRDSSWARDKKRHAKWFGGAEPFGFPVAFITILTDGQKQILQQKRDVFRSRFNDRSRHAPHETR